MLARHARVDRLGESLPPTREVLEGLVLRYAVAVVVHDGDLGKVNRLHAHLLSIDRLQEKPDG